LSQGWRWRWIWSIRLRGLGISPSVASVQYAIFSNELPLAQKSNLSNNPNLSNDKGDNSK
jgi:hypothetical protein